jgi:LCP family protein required for cell wall assembly
MRRHDEAGEQARPRTPSWARRLLPQRRPGRKRNRSTVVLGTLAVFIAVVLAGGTLAAYAKYRAVWDGIHRIDVSSDVNAPNLPPPDPHAQNILIIGSDSRAGRNGKIGGGADNVGGARSDTVMLVHVAPGAHQVVVLSFPRDSVVPILGCTPEGGAAGQSAQPSYAVEQINSSFAYGGPGCLWKTIEETTGIHVNDFIELNFVGFEKVIDALHGVTVCLPYAINDPTSRLDLTAGRHHVFGREALAFWRTREGVGLGDDPQRIQRDQYLMASLVRGIEHSSLLKSPHTMLSVIDALTSGGYLTTDSGLSPGSMLRFGEGLRGVPTSAVQFVTVPWNTYTGNAQWLSSSQSPAAGNSNWVQWVQPQANALFSAISKDVKLPKTTKQKIKTVSPASVKVRVMNGTTTAGIGTSTAASLHSRGFDVVGRALDASTQNYTTTVIEYSSAAQLPAAQTLAGLFSDVTVKQDAHLPNAGTLRLILGSTFTSLTGSSGGSGSSGSAGVSNLANTYGGITANVNLCSDSNAFSS